MCWFFDFDDYIVIIYIWVLMINKEILPFSSRRSPDYLLQNNKRWLKKWQEKFWTSEEGKLALYFLLSDDQDKPKREKWSTEYVIPYIKNLIVTVFNKENSPYKILDRFLMELAAKVKFLPQYGIIYHTLEGIKYQHNHDRKIHSIDVSLLLERIAFANNLSKKETILLILAGLLHDIATPVWGDVTMKIFKDLKEEDNFEMFMCHYPEIVDVIQKEFWISIQQLASCIKNEWLYGKLLDIADKVAYTLRDIRDLTTSKTAKDLEKVSPYFVDLQNIISQNPLLGETINDVGIEWDAVFFKNPDQLLSLLTARAYMHNIIYLNPEVHSREHIMWLSISFLLEQKFLTKEELIFGKKNDMVFSIDLLLQKYEKQEKIPYSARTYPDVDFFEKQSFSTPEERAVATKEFLINHPEYKNLIFYIKTPKFKSGSQFLVDINEKKQPLSAVLSWDPRLEILESLAKNTERYLLLYPTENFMQTKNNYPEFYNFLMKESQKSLEK